MSTIMLSQKKYYCVNDPGAVDHWIGVSANLERCIKIVTEYKQRVVFFSGDIYTHERQF
jgi:hypothetical protein